MSAVLDVLKRVRARLSDPARWAKGYFAYTADGKVCDSTSPRATCWCLMGAVAVEEQGSFEVRFDTAEALRQAVGEPADNIVAWNDAPERTLDEVLAAIDRAIATEEARP